MATKYTLKRKLYADGERSNTGAKLLAGGAALAGGFAAAKHGMLGNSLAKSANRAWASAGKAVGSSKMIESGAKGYGEAVANQVKADFTRKYGTDKAAKLTEDRMARLTTIHANKIRTANGAKAKALPNIAAEKKKIAEEAKKKAQEQAKQQSQKKAEEMSAEELNASRKANRQSQDAAYKAEQERQAAAEAERKARSSQRKPLPDPTKGMTDAQKAVYNEAMAAGNFNRVEAIKYARQFSHSGSIMSFLWR